jgi:phosphonate dehydrogenase
MKPAAGTPDRPLVVITNWVHQEVLDRLAPHARLVANPSRTPWTRHQVLQRATEADCLLAFMTDRVDRDFLARCPRLRVVACALKGHDNFDVAACTEAGVWLSIVPDLLTAPTAELAVGLAIALGRQVRPGDDWVRAGHFDGWRPQLYGRGLAGSVAGLAGFGRVGRAIAERLQGFGARLLAFDALPLAPGGPPVGLPVRAVTWPELLAESDYLFVALPLGPTTLHLFDSAALRAMKRGALLINAGRGSVVDEAAVAASLAEGHLGGYAADVFEMEDWARPDRPAGIAPGLLADKTRTLLTPHLGSAVDDVRRDIALAAAHNIACVLQGQPPPDAVNRSLRPRS